MVINLTTLAHQAKLWIIKLVMLVQVLIYIMLQQQGLQGYMSHTK